jgi:cobalt/nickel transport system permease protein
MILADRLAYASRWRARSLAEKSLLSLGLLVLALGLEPGPASALVLASAVCLALVAGTPWRAWLRLMAAPAAFVASGVLALLVDVDGGGPHLAADHGMRAAQVAVRALAAMAALLLLAVTTPTPDLIHGLRRLGLPAELAELALAIYRFIFVLQETAAAMHAGQAARLGTDGWRRRVRSVGMLVAALLPRALEQAHRQEIGLAARGFDGALRTLSPERAVRPLGLAWVALVLAAVAGAGSWL